MKILLIGMFDLFKSEAECMLEKEREDYLVSVYPMSDARDYKVSEIWEIKVGFSFA
jgi:hypothetical protein